MTALEQSVEVISSRFFSATANSEKEDHHFPSSAAAAAAFLKNNSIHNDVNNRRSIDGTVNEQDDYEGREESKDNDDSVYEKCRRRENDTLHSTKCRLNGIFFLLLEEKEERSDDGDDDDDRAYPFNVSSSKRFWRMTRLSRDHV
eukprot:CAMPEP_0196133780 /NCGR_PEP_ID=MMETSP0910-20130528/2853_1 /TAXON_ID=49265 /ORGANISM="Thalassiosira rotula, Strain GSO102" /LENGTH=144 /DNA_ID=CAMNT_0041393531 /DNA_START=666 /DNA_END=1101 /DNA_ORIENTATION=+